MSCSHHPIQAFLHGQQAFHFVIKYANDASLTVKEKHPLYGIKKEILNFIANISSSDTKSALENYYRLAI